MLWTWEQHQYRHVYCVHAIDNESNINEGMSTVYMLLNMRVTSLYACLLCTCTEQWEQHQCTRVYCVHAMNMRTTSKYTCLLCTFNEQWQQHQCMSTVYMQWTMRATSIYACPLCTCYGKWEQHQYMHIHCVHAMENKGNINVCVSTVYMLSTIRVSTVSIYPPLCTSVLSRTNCAHSSAVGHYLSWFLISSA